MAVAVVVAAGSGGDNDTRVGAVEVSGNRGADAARATGDQRASSLQFGHCGPPTVLLSPRSGA